MSDGEYGYEKNPVVAREFIESLIEKGNPEAIRRKIEGLVRGSDIDYPSYRCHCAAVEGYGRYYGGMRLRDISTFTYPSYGYKKSPAAVRDFIEELIISEIPIVRAIGKYIRAFAQKYGVPKLGYEREYEEAIEFIKQHHIPY